MVVAALNFSSVRERESVRVCQQPENSCLPGVPSKARWTSGLRRSVISIPLPAWSACRQRNPTEGMWSSATFQPLRPSFGEPCIMNRFTLYGKKCFCDRQLRVSGFPHSVAIFKFLVFAVTDSAACTDPELCPQTLQVMLKSAQNQKLWWDEVHAPEVSRGVVEHGCFWTKFQVY